MNSDAAESFGSWVMGDDTRILDSVTSVNVACGFHGGDARTMHRVTALAAQRGIAVGAHVGYRDLPGFGRRFIAYSYDDLFAETLYQLGALRGIARTQGTDVTYVKPHGALGHAIMHDDTQARAVIDAVAAFDSSLALLLMPGSTAVEHASTVGLRVVLEAFADRAYLPDGRLVPPRRRERSCTTASRSSRTCSVSWRRVWSSPRTERTWFWVRRASASTATPRAPSRWRARSGRPSRQPV